MARSISQPRRVAKRESVALRGCVNSATSLDMDWIDLAVILAALAVGGILTLPALARAPLWRAALTPLASIIGSGFLVLGPILAISYGRWAPLAMAALCVAAYALGGAVRANIARRAAGPRTRAEEALDRAASWVLAFAYIISVAYYLGLFGAFALERTGIASDISQRGLTTAVFLVILVTGWTKGFAALERMEQVAVSLKLAVIGGLLAGMATVFATASGPASPGLTDAPASVTGWAALSLAFGLIVTVQGFETSRYLGAEYDPATRNRSMRLAQIVSTAIYMGYVLLLTALFDPSHMSMSETAIIALMDQIAPSLPLLLILAALVAQFSAAVADTGGAGGLLAELTSDRIAPRTGYAILAAFGIALTWSADIYAIIAYASRAFALYYALQCAIAARGHWTEARLPALWYSALSLTALAMALFGTPVEGG